MLTNGSLCYVIVSNREVVPAEVLKYSGGFYTVRLNGETGAIRLRSSRIFETEDEAKRKLGLKQDSKQRLRYNPYNHM